MTPDGARPRRAPIYAAVALVLSTAAPLDAEVVRVEVERREPFAGGYSFGRTGPYERLTGKIYFAVDPDFAANARIVDLRLAPRQADGRVAFRADFFLLKPLDASRGNRALLYCVNNRGNKLALGAFNGRGGNDPATLEDAGNGFLMREGYSILWSGWNGDVLPGGGRLTIDLPVARGAGSAGGEEITARVYAEVCVNQRSLSEPFAWGNSRPYPVVSLDTTLATLSMRPRRDAEAVAIPPDAWSFARAGAASGGDGETGRAVPDPLHLYVKDGFRPGWLYDLVYTATGPRVTGLGFAAVRDAVAFFRRAASDSRGGANPLAGTIDRAFAFGISQSGRFITHLVYEGFHVDEHGRTVFEAAMPHVGGGGKGFFNGRFVQTTRHGSQHEERLFPSDFFPFATVPQRDPVTGEEGDILARARASGCVPKLFFTETSTEYWSRAASLLSTDVDGRVDVDPAPEARIYVIAGAQHGVAGSSERGIYAHPINVLDHRPVLRALLVALDAWVTAGREPPPSRFPRIADDTLGDLDAYRRGFPALPGAKLPAKVYTPRRLDLGPRWRTEGIIDHAPPLAGEPFRVLVPAVDADGNERAGIRLPDVAVPVAAYTGWNLRGEECGAEGMLSRWSGAYFPFARDRAERERTQDPRPSVHERYPTREVYLARFLEAALVLESERLLLAEDVVELTRAAARRALWTE